MPLRLTSRAFASLLATTPFLTPARAQESWAEIEAQAKGQTVYFNAWAGSPQVNAYIAWAADEVNTRYGITLEHVKLTDTAEAVRRVRDEVKAGGQGSADLIWINGQNFHVMKEEQLLYGPFTEDLPNFALVDIDGKPTTIVDFAEGTEGLESPWGMAQLTFFADGAKLDTPPMSMMELLDLARDEPGRITYPAPPDFHGNTFLKQALAETMDDRALLPMAIGTVSFCAAQSSRTTKPASVVAIPRRVTAFMTHCLTGSAWAGMAGRPLVTWNRGLRRLAAVVHRSAGVQALRSGLAPCHSPV
jgi:putative thiamine transport system substrate-binding protein